MEKLIVVTGGSKGIGKAIVLKFAKEGYNIITCARSEKKLKALTEEVKAIAAGIKIFTFKADLSIKDEVTGFIEFIQSKTKTVDVLINNTGLFIPGKVHEEEDGILEHLIETNLYSAYHMCRGLIPSMVKQRSGHIFNMCSTASIMPYMNGGSYGITKYALFGMTKVLREEMKQHNVKVTAILPGATFTTSWEGVDLPEDRFMKVEDIADVVYGSYKLSKNAVVEEILIRPQLGDI